MLYIIISTLFLIPAIVGIGAAIEKKISFFTHGISSNLLFGIVAITIFWTILSFFFPLNIAVEIVTLIFGFSLFFSQKKYLNFWFFLKKNKVLLPIFFLITAFFGSFYPYILDHFGYYVPSVNWLSKVGLVRGIANLDLILGQMSFWHIFQAGFSNFSDVFLRINSLVLIVYIIYIFENKSWIHLIFLPFFFLFVQQPSPDLPVMVFSLIILNEILLGNKNGSAIFMISVVVFAIKPTAVWLPIVSFLYSQLILKSNFKSYIPAILILLLFFIKNMWTFGYPVFPVQIADFGLFWKPNPEILKTSSQLSIEKTYDLQYTFSQIQKFSFSEHITNWLFIKGIKGKIHLLFIFSLLVFLAFTFIKKNKIFTIIFVSILIKSLLILLFSAQYRFFLDVFFVVIFVFFYQNFSKIKGLLIFSAFTIIIGGILSFPKIIQTQVPSFNLGFAMGGFQINQLYKPSEYVYRNFETYQIGNLKFNLVREYPFSFDTPIPAISPSYIKEYYDAGIFPQLKGKTTKEGFIWRKISVEEKQIIQKIILKNK